MLLLVHSHTAAQVWTAKVYSHTLHHHYIKKAKQHVHSDIAAQAPFFSINFLLFSFTYSIISF